MTTTPLATPFREMTPTQEAAARLAVRYQAYLEAIEKSDSTGIVVWGRALLEAQDDLGFHLVEPTNVDRMIECHRGRTA